MTPSRTHAVLITGCSSGIGRATAVRFAREGWTVIATARAVADIAGLEADGCRVMTLDVTNEASMRVAVSAVEAEHGAVSVLVNNAGYSQSGAIETVPIDRVRAQFETNVFGLVRLTQLVLPGMRRARRGRIVNLSSIGGRLVFPGAGYYHATKHAVEALSDALRFEVARFGIDVIVIEPGLIRTSFATAATAALRRGRGTVESAGSPYDRFHETVARATTESYVKGPLAPLVGTPEDVAAVIARAVGARRPRTRYTVSASAPVLLGLHRLLGDRLWDRFLSRTFSRPGDEGPR